VKGIYKRNFFRFMSRVISITKYNVFIRVTLHS